MPFQSLKFGLPQKTVETAARCKGGADFAKRGNCGIMRGFRTRSSVGRVSVSEAEGRWFDPSRVRHIRSKGRLKTCFQTAFFLSARPCGHSVLACGAGLRYLMRPLLF